MKTFRIAALVGGLLLLGGAAPALAQESAQPAAAPQRCSTTQLQVRLGRVDAGAGNRYAPLVFTNRSRATCTVRGYPGLVMLDERGDALRTRVRRTPGAHPKVTLRPGGSARAVLHWTVVESGGETDCPGANRLLVIAPDDRTYTTIAFGADRVCGQGRLDVAAIK
ncbi:DUF4232 domain-containing protein [Nonomuraea aurantiaca]|uniref:DUF4232 domain-containing protein n=1 Tax=Nonomuraea aurantiaca TaxID=2878562 RepID=UPI001CD9CBBB|nr:DUF4232 domain-containing protein [Nonomuraea aurantiaca]MCA2222789.1 DUF4232 domain-containing protein [Nonomuraea aurantiaca]